MGKSGKSRTPRRRAAPKHPKRLDPAALTPAEMAEVLTRTGGEDVTEGAVAADVASGAPTNPDGTLNIVRYAAWLALTEIDGGSNGAA